MTISMMRTEMRAQGLGETIDARGVAENEARHEPEGWIVDLAALGDRETGAGSLRRKFVRPRAAEWQVRIRDPDAEKLRAPALHHLERDGVAAGKLAPSNRFEAEHVNPLYIPAPVRVPVHAPDRREYVGGWGRQRERAAHDMVLGQGVPHDEHDGNTSRKCGDDQEDRSAKHGTGCNYTPPGSAASAAPRMVVSISGNVSRM